MKAVKLHCPACRRDMPVPPHKCPDCGGDMILEAAKTGASPLAVIILLFFVLGPLGLGILWRSERFTRPSKWALTVITLAYTAAVIWAGYAIIVATYNYVSNITGTLSSYGL